ncbi:MAG: hypothetical protein IID51_11970, partial [Proteobacteria bacterium]|nr:hypothetical protein [Pseudomonadota bacterium]
MTDTRYLKKRGGRWSFQIAVPKDLQKRFGKAVITQSLGTSEIRLAKDLRWKYLAAAKEAFLKARDGQGLSSEEIEELAQKELR